MIVEYVHKRLIAWGEGVIRGRNAGRNGYPSQSAFARLMPSSEASAWSPLLDVEVDQVDQCVLRLEATRRELVTRYYTRPVSAAQLARELGCCEKTIFNRLAIAHSEMLGLLNDLAAGVDLPPVVFSMDSATAGADKSMMVAMRQQKVVDVRYSEN